MDCILNSENYKNQIIEKGLQQLKLLIESENSEYITEDKKSFDSFRRIFEQAGFSPADTEKIICMFIAEYKKAD